MASKGDETGRADRFAAACPSSGSVVRQGAPTAARCPEITAAQPGRRYPDAAIDPGATRASCQATPLPALPTLWRLRRDPLRLVRDLYGRPPGAFVFSLLGRKHIVLSDPELVRYVLAENAENYRKNYGAFLEAVGRSSLVTHGQEWKAVRTVNQQAFRSELLHDIVAANQPIIDGFVAKLHRHAAAHATIDVGRAFGGLMIELTASGMFARRTPRPPDRIFDDVDCFLPVMDRCAFRVTALGRYLVRRSRPGFADAIGRWRDLPRQIREDPAMRNEEGSLLWQLATKFDPEGSDAEGARIIRDEIMLFLAAGSQTSAATLGFALLLLWQHPEVLRLVRAQLHELGPAGAAVFPSAERLTILANVVAEALRLFPPVWMITRVAIGRDQIAGVSVERNDMVLVSYFGLHRSAAHWRNPDEFDPSRFEKAAAAARRSYVYLPFGAGPRACIGAQLAGMQVVSILAAVVGAFDIEFLRGRAGLSDVELHAGISLWPKKPLLAKLTALPQAPHHA